MEKRILRKLAEKLEGLDYFLFSGSAVEIYTNGKRKAADVDILIKRKDIDTFAGRLGCKAGMRRKTKNGIKIEEYSFGATFHNVELDVTSGITRCVRPSGEALLKNNNNLLRELFKKKVKKTYKGVQLFVAPLEDLIVQKATMDRPKDRRDLELLKNENVDKKFLCEVADAWGSHRNVKKMLKKRGWI